VSQGDPTSTPPRKHVLAAATVIFRPDAALLQALIDALPGTARPVFVFANGPHDDAIETILSNSAGVHVLRSEKNVGQGAGLNRVMEAAANAAATHVVLFDQDSTPPPDLADALLMRFATIERNGVKLAALGPKLVTPPGTRYLPITYWRRKPKPGEPQGAVDFLPTSGTLLSLDAWRDVGPFRSDYFIGGIDVEWCYRAWAKGWACAVADDITMEHRWGEDDRGDKVGSQFLRQSPDRLYYYLRNAADGLRLSHMPVCWKRRQLTRMTAQATLAALMRRDFPLTEALRAVRDGWRGKLGPLS